MKKYRPQQVVNRSITQKVLNEETGELESKTFDERLASSKTWAFVGQMDVNLFNMNDATITITNTLTGGLS